MGFRIWHPVKRTTNGTAQVLSLKDPNTPASLRVACALGFRMSVKAYTYAVGESLGEAAIITCRRCGEQETR